MGTGALVGFVLDSEAVVVVVGDLSGNDPCSEFLACFIIKRKAQDLINSIYRIEILDR